MPTTARLAIVLSLLLLAATRPAVAAGDFMADARKTAAAVQEVMPDLERRMTAGDFAGADAALEAAFPAATRTAAESFVLGNVLYETDPAKSYALHEAAAKAEPDNPEVAWEWGMQQHRAGRHAEALAAYQKYSAARPRQAAAYALAADCLLRLGRVDEAVAAWKRSEDAPDGSLETMESLVCAVHREPAPYRRRADLLAKVARAKDVDAAAELIALDCDFPRDWWNAGPMESYLAHDLPAVKAALGLPADDVRLRAIACAAACASADPEDAAAVKAILAEHRLLTDADHTVPANGGLLAAILRAAVAAKAIDDATLRGQVGPKVEALARKSKDVRLWDVAAYVGAKGRTAGQALAFERDGWAATNDAKFAVGVLRLKAAAGTLKGGDDADLAAAVKQFPENGAVRRVAYEVAVKENKVTRELLVAAARAEFTKFSSFVAPATVVDRPRSNYLRAHFAQLRRMPPAAAATTTKPADR